MKCQHCEVSVDLPFKCPFCGGYFCADHRLPENHVCPELWRVMVRGREPHKYVSEEAVPKEKPSYGYVPDFRIKSRWFSSIEILHLTAGTLMVMAVGLSFVLQSGLLLGKIELWIGAALVFTSICILHELAHKAVAKHYGLWAEFRLNLIGALVTMLSIVLPIKFVSPGAVMISGEANKRIVGVTALAGPFTNIVLSPLFFVLSCLVPRSAFSLIMILGAILSSEISLFNLIPFSILDGAKIFWWNRKAWAISFFASLILTLAVTITFLTF